MIENLVHVVELSIILDTCKPQIWIAIKIMLK